MKPLIPNTLIQNRYLIIQLIGKGGMGEVYLAVDQRLGSGVALKRTFFSDDEMLGNAFEREAKTLARLRHPVLPKVSDHFTEDGTQYLVMEHISGDDLSKRLEGNNKPFPLNWVLFWADQLLDGLVYLHSHEPQIIHRDIKPQNLKLTDENHIILLDFGLAKNSRGQTRVTTAGSIVGYTPHYASMEQIRGTGTTPKSDIYSLCATLYQLLTNSVPADALTRADSLLNSLPDPLRPLNEVNPEVPKAISDVIIRGMSLSADQRYENARDMQKALREAYSEMQQVMSAQTVAFTVDKAAAPSPEPASQIPSGDLAQTAFVEVPLENIQQEPEVLEASVPQQAENIHLSAQPNLEQTVNYSDISTPILDHTVNYSQEAAPVLDQTINYSQEAMQPVIDEAVNYSQPPVGEKTEVFTNDIASEPEQIPQSSYSPEATVPLIHFNNQGTEPSAETDQTAANFNGDEYAGVQDYQQNNQYDGDVREETVQPAYAPAPAARQAQAKKSGGMGKTLGILGGILGLGIVGAGAAAVGWYALGSSSTAAGTPSPTPVISIPSTPIVEATPEPTPEPTTNPGLSNSNSTISDPGNTSIPNTLSNTGDSNVDSPGGKKTVLTPDKTPRPNIQEDRPTPPPAKTPAPTPKVSTTPVKPPKTPVPPKSTPKGTIYDQ